MNDKITTIPDVYLKTFVTESNAIEGIHRDPEDKEIEAHKTFLRSCAMIHDLVDFVCAIAPGHVLREKPGLDVRIGNHIPPPGGPLIRTKLMVLLSGKKTTDPWKLHCDYETLHPFTDGNGRSGRALWLWMMIHNHGYDLRRGFLHEFYYQTLNQNEGRK